MVAGTTALQLGAGENLVRQVVELAGLPRALEDPGVPRAGVYRAGYVQESLAGYSLNFPPQLVGALEEQHVRGVLVIRQPDDAGVAVRRAHGVRDAEPFQPEHTLAATSEVVGGGATHPPHANDDNVVTARVGDAHEPGPPFAYCLAGAFEPEPVVATGRGVGSERRPSSVGLDRMRAFSGSKNGVWAILAGMGRPLISTIRLLPGQEWAVST